MQHTKAEILKEEINELRNKVFEQHRIIQQTLTLLKDFDFRLNAIQILGTENKAWTSDDFEAMVDKHRGLRKREAFEPIEEGDVAWVAYSATVDGEKELIKEEGLPIRVGSGVVIFEKALVGKLPVTKGIEFSSEFATGPMAGKTVKFVVDILKVKTKVKDDGTRSAAAAPSAE